MIKEEVVWGVTNRERAMVLAENLLCREGYEVIVQHVKKGNFFSDQTPVIYLIVERKVEK
jgi:hypothetical protein